MSAYYGGRYYEGNTTMLKPVLCNYNKCPWIPVKYETVQSLLLYFVNLLLQTPLAFKRSLMLWKIFLNDAALKQNGSGCIKYEQINSEWHLSVLNKCGNISEVLRRQITHEVNGVFVCWMKVLQILHMCARVCVCVCGKLGSNMTHTHKHTRSPIILLCVRAIPM